MRHGFLKVAAISPDLTEGALSSNARAIKNAIAEAHAAECAFLVLPRCAITGGGAPDRRIPLMLAQKAEELLLDIAAFTLKRDIHCLISTPMRIDENIVYVTAVVSKGKILAVVPESKSKVNFEEITLGDYAVPYGSDIIIKAQNNDYLNIGIVSGALSEGLDRADKLIELGASIIMHTASQSVSLDSPVYEATMISAFTARTKTAYVYASGSKDSFSAVSKSVIIAENGDILASGYDGITNTAISDIDTDLLLNIRVISDDYTGFTCPPSPSQPAFVEIDTGSTFSRLTRSIKRLPYLPNNPARYNYAIELVAREVYSRTRNDIQKLCLPADNSVNFLLALTVLYVMCSHYHIEQKNVAVLKTCALEPEVENAISLSGFYKEEIPSAFQQKLNQGIMVSEAILRWTRQNNAQILGVKDMTDIALSRFGTPLDKAAALNIFSTLPKTYINAAAVNNTFSEPVLSSLRGLSAALLSKADQNSHAYMVYDFVMYYFGGLGMKKSKVMYLLQNAFEDVPLFRLNKWLNEFLAKYLSYKATPQDNMPEFMGHPTPFYHMGGEEILKPYLTHEYS